MSDVAAFFAQDRCGCNARYAAAPPVTMRKRLRSIGTVRNSGPRVPPPLRSRFERRGVEQRNAESLAGT